MPKVELFRLSVQGHIDWQNLLDAVSETIDFSHLEQLNRAVVTRMRALRGVEESTAALGFTLGQQVEFTGKRGIHRGTVIKVNRKSISVKETSGPRWNVSPTLLRPVRAAIDHVKA